MLISIKYSLRILSHKLISKKIIKKFMSFVSIGAVMTLSTLATNFVLLKFYKTPLILTYTCVYFTSILISFLLNSKYTFKTSISLSNGIKYYLIYGTSMILGIVLLMVYKHYITLENWVYPFLVLPFTVACNFTLSNWLLKKPA